MVGSEVDWKAEADGEFSRAESYVGELEADLRDAKRKAKATLANDEARFLIQPVDGAAVIQIGKSIYLVREGTKPDGFRYWTFRTKKGGCYTVDRRGIGMGCTCPDRLFRKHECKHTRAVRVLYGIGDTVPRDLIAAGLKY